MREFSFGMPTLMETSSIEQCIGLCRELGLSFIELNMNLPEYQIDAMDIPYLKSICEKENIYFTIHIDENSNVCDFNNDVADAYTKTILSTIKAAKELKVPVLNMHMPNGVYFTLPDKKVFLFDKYKDIYMAKLRAFMYACEKATGDSGIKICIENCSEFKNFTKHGIELLLKSNVFALTFDIGHNHSANRIDEGFIFKHIDKLYHMHIHDAIGRENHLPLGQGEVDIREKILLGKKQKCRMVIETKTIEGLKQSVMKLKGYVE